MILTSLWASQLAFALQVLLETCAKLSKNSVVDRIHVTTVVSVLLQATGAYSATAVRSVIQ